jgi:LmbE family N-acetylglucosaminyl deacetylase
VFSQKTNTPKTIVVVLAHADDETPAAPALARFAREGAQVYLVIASDGAASTAQGFQGGSDSTVRGGLANVRADEARCAAEMLGARPPILLGFPDGKLGDFTADRSLLFRLSDRLAAELKRLQPDVLITWGPDGGFGHPDHRMVNSVVTQLVRAGAPGTTEQLFYLYIPPEGFRSMNMERGEPAFVVPQVKHLTTRVSFSPADLDAAQRAMGCHRSQYTAETVQRVFPAQARFWNGSVTFAPAFSTSSGNGLFAHPDSP